MSKEYVAATVVHGSHLYGTSIEGSDEDFKTVFVPSSKKILMQGANSCSFPKLSEDHEFFSLHRFVDLLLQNQTICIDMVFAPESLYKETSWVWKTLVNNRHRFLSRDLAAFVGYCRKQAGQYCAKASHLETAAQLRWALLEIRPEYPDFQSVPPLVMDLLTKIPGVEILRGPDRLVFCGRSILLTSTIPYAVGVVQKVVDRYGERARKVQSQDGVDWKSLMHAVRIAEEAVDLLTTGSLIFPRPNANHLRDIRLGLIPFKEVTAEISCLVDSVEYAKESTTLPNEPDRKFAEQFITDVYYSQMSSYPE